MHPQTMEKLQLFRSDTILIKLRREKIAERMKALQELVPNANKGERLHVVLPKSQIDEDELFDVVAMVVGKEDPKEMLTEHGNELKRLVIVLKDIELVLYTFYYAL